jgi:hypothetical protein
MVLMLVAIPRISHEPPDTSPVKYRPQNAAEAADLRQSRQSVTQ